MRFFPLAALLLGAAPGGPARAAQDEIMAQCPVAARDAQALLVDVETTQQESVGLTGPALDQRQCRAFDSGVPRAERIVAELRECQARGATGLEPTIQRMARMSVQFRSAMAMVCR